MLVSQWKMFYHERGFLKFHLFIIFVILLLVKKIVKPDSVKVSELT